MLDRTGKRGVCDSSKGTGSVELSIAKVSLIGRVAGFKGTTSPVEGAELHRNTSTNADERSQSAFVKGQWSFILENLGARVDGAGVS